MPEPPQDFFGKQRTGRVYLPCGNKYIFSAQGGRDLLNLNSSWYVYLARAATFDASIVCVRTMHDKPSSAQQWSAGGQT